MGVIVEVVMVIMMVMIVMLVAAIGAMKMRFGADAHMVAVPMMRIAVMRMIVRAMKVIVIVTMDGRGRDIGAALRVEGGLDRRHFRAEPARHILDDMVAPDAQALGQEFGRQVTRTSAAASAPRISASCSGAATTSTMRPSSSASPSPARSITASGRSSRKARPRTPVIAIRRR